MPSARCSARRSVSTEAKPLALATYANVPATGLLLDGTPWAALPFVEGETLHYKPAVAAATACTWVRTAVAPRWVAS